MSSHPARRLAIIAVVAIIAVTGAIVVSSSSGEDPPGTSLTAPPDILAGVPESAGGLGDPQAPITVTEFVDPQCPVCAAASREILPTLVSEYVRTGKVKLDAQVLSFLGPDSVTAARFAAGARAQDHLWPYLESLYANQGPENSGYIDEAFLNAIAALIGVDEDDAARTADSARGQDAISAANAEAQRLGVNATPTFVLTRGDGSERVLSGAEILDVLGGA